MSETMMALFDMLIVFGGALGFGLWQLYSVRKSLREPPAKPGAETNTGHDNKNLSA